MASVALVTGAAQGIGRAIAIRLANDGYDVALDDIEAKREQLDSAVKEIQSLGRRAITLTEDVTKEDGVKQMVEQTVTTLGRLDVVGVVFSALLIYMLTPVHLSKMVANAGIAPKMKPLVEGRDMQCIFKRIQI